MASAFGFCKSVYRTVLPQKLRHRLYQMTPLPLQRFRSKIVSQIEKSAGHDEIYDAEYYAKSVEPGMRLSAEIIADSIISAYSPKKIVDVGCGSGGLMEALAARGVSCMGLEYSQAAIDLCTKRGLSVSKFDLEGAVPFNETADVAVSTEVAEHLPASAADRYVDLLCAISGNVVLTAAIPDGPAGTDHVNEQPNEYWIAKFEARGYRYDMETSHHWREEWKNKGASSIYYRSIMTFSRRGAAVS